MANITADQIRASIAARQSDCQVPDFSNLRVMIEEACEEFLKHATIHGCKRWEVNCSLADHLTEFLEYDNDERYTDIYNLTPLTQEAAYILKIMKEKGIGIAIYNCYDFDNIEMILSV